MRELLGCVLLWGCLPTAELDLPPRMPEPEAWAVVGQIDGRAIGGLFAPDDVEFFADTDQPITAIAYSIPLEDLQLALGPLRITESGRELPTDPSIAEIFTSDPAPIPRGWTPGGPTYFVEELDPNACFERGRCRPDEPTFSHCETTCGAESLEGPSPPPPVTIGAPLPLACGARFSFPTGCARIGPECPADWPDDLPPDAIKVEDVPSLSLAIETASTGATIAVRGTLRPSRRLSIERPLTLRGTCVEGAVIANLHISSSGVMLRALTLEGLAVEADGAVAIEQSRIDGVTSDGTTRVAESVLYNFRARDSSLWITDSMAAGDNSCLRGSVTAERTLFRDTPLVFDDCTVALTDVTAHDTTCYIRGGMTHLARIAYDGPIQTLNGTLTVSSSFLRSIAATESNATIENTTLANIDGEKTGLDALGTTVTMTGVSVTSTAGGVKLIDSDASLASVSIRAGTIALTHRARSEFPELKATDIDLNGDIALAISGDAAFTRASMSARSIGIDASGALRRIELEDLQLASDNLGIVATPDAPIAVKDFYVVARTAVLVVGVAENISFRRGTIDSANAIQHEGDRFHDFFIQTIFASDP